jgi:hypothetical protein
VNTGTAITRPAHLPTAPSHVADGRRAQRRNQQLPSPPLHFEWKPRRDAEGWDALRLNP